MRRFAVVTALVLATVVHRQAEAQASVAGTWTTEFDIGIRNENGVETSMGKRQATMTLTLKGDSVIGTWQVAAQGDGPAPAPITLRGTRSGSKVTLAAAPVERTVRINDDEQQVKMVTKYVFEVRGDELVGTSQNTTADNSFDGPARPFSAKRK